MERVCLQVNKCRHFKLRDDKGTGLCIVLGLIFLVLSMTGCSTIVTQKYTFIPIDQFPAFTGSESSEILPQSVDYSVPDVDILKLNDEMRSVLDESIVPLKNPQARLEMLLRIINTRVSYSTAADDGAKTAIETFETRTGNCLSLSNLFISMARYSGLKTAFQEIPVPPFWKKSGVALFFTRHIGASVNLDTTQEDGVRIDSTNSNSAIMRDNMSFYLLTPSLMGAGTPAINPLFTQPIPDNRAFAQYYNNIGANCLAEGNGRDAFRYFIKAVKTDPRLGFAWSNLGVVYSRNNQIDAAEMAYLQALSINRGIDETSAMNVMGNLEKLYRKIGNSKQAAFYEKEIAFFRNKNPYYHYSLGKTAYYDGNFEEAVKHFKDAIGQKEDEHLFHYTLALAYLRLGNIKMAEKTIVRAELFAWDEKIKLDYELLRERMVKYRNEPSLEKFFDINNL